MKYLDWSPEEIHAFNEHIAAQDARIRQMRAFHGSFKLPLTER